MCDNNFLRSVFADLISADFEHESAQLRRIYDAKYEHRHAFGLCSSLDDERLEDEWRFKYLKLQKRRNWLWYLMINSKFVELDEVFNTDYTFSQADLRLRLEYSEYKKKENNRYKYINKKHSFVNFSSSGLPVEELEECYINPFDNNDTSPSVVYIKKKRARSYEPLIDNNRVYNKTTVDTRDYNILYSAALRLFNLISKLRVDRLPNRVISIFKKKNKHVRESELIELDTLAYQSGGFETPIVTDEVPVKNLLKSDNRPMCCSYCPVIVCLSCFKGEGCCECEKIIYQGNVEQNVGGDTDVVQVDKANNVVLTETEISQIDNTALNNSGWSRLVSSDTVSNMNTLVNRWFRVGTYSWSTSMSRNNTVRSIDLPRAAIFSGTSTCDQPNKIPFRIHRYWRGNMHIKIHINCNKFQIGQLQCAWYYQPKADDSFTSKANVYTRSGAHHCVISAAPNNEVEMFIPFKAYKSMYHTKSYSGDGHDLPLDLGTLFITVLSPLKTTGETSPKCSFTVFVKFSDNEFTGMLAGNINTPAQLDEDLSYQMEAGSLLSSAIPLVEKMLVGSRNDNNRDNPPLNAPPHYFVPTASHSWSIGTDLIEPLHNLRLSGRAQTKHPDVDLDEMRIDVIKRKYMLQDIFSWSQQDNNGKELWSLPVNPFPPKDRLYQTSAATTSQLTAYQLTPIGFLSSLYQYWRGSIEYRFDIVASQFHSGKLLLAYIPGIAEGGVVTIEQARASPNIVLSLDNAMSYTWRVPYVADRPWWPRRYSGESVSNNSISPSKIFVFVLNELVMAETVPDSVEILVYMRGGEDMEFSVPVQPSIGLGYDRSYISQRNTTNVFPVSTTYTYYAGNWHKVPDVLVWRHAATSEAVGRFSEPILDRPVYYHLSSNNPTANVSSTGNTQYAITMCIFLKGIGFSEYIGLPLDYGNPSPTGIARLESIARVAFNNKYVYGAWVKNWVISSPADVGFIPASYVTTSNTYGGGKAIPWTAVEVSPTLEDLEFQGNREESLALIDNTQSLRSTNNGLLTYGERFVDLKDLGRRYQIYGWTTVPKEQIERDPGACSFLFPVLPQGLSLAINTPNQVNQIWNRAREGHIPLIASLYRFYRGSLRVRIVVTNGDGLTMWVQHRPDRRLERNVITPCVQVSTAEAVFNHTYGMYMQSLNVNHIVEIEVPFYQMANFGLLQKPVIFESSGLRDWSSFYSLGELSIGFFGDMPANDVRCTIYYSMADDCRFSTYQGVPPMVIIDDLPEFQIEELKYQGLKDMLRINTVELGCEVADSATTRIVENVNTQVMPMLNEFLSNFTSKMSDTYSSVKEHIVDSSFYSKISSIGSQIIHAINNPTPSTIAISVVSILITLGIVTYNVYHLIHKYVVSIWEWISNIVSSKKSREEVESAQEATEELSYQDNSSENASVGFLSLVCGGLCALFGIKNSLKYKPVSDSLFTGISNGMKMSNVCFVFFKNLMSVIGDIKAAIVAYLYPGFNAAESLMQGRDIIEKWINYAQDLLDPMVAQHIQYDRELQVKLLDCYAFGKILKVKALETQYPAVIQLINTTFDKLHRKHVDLVAQGLDPHVRKMPFVIYNYGMPEIGKSHLTDDLCVELCKSQDITTETDLMCILNATSKFWDNCDRQPCLVMDDAFNIRKGPMLEDQIASIFNVVSPVVLVPPKAAVEDKGRMYNPEIFILNSNIDFFKTELCVEEALWRRRDILIKTELDLEYVKEGCIHCSEKLKVNSSLPPEAVLSLTDYHHLKFKYTFDVKNPDCVYQPSDRYIKYPELLALLKKIFKTNREAEAIKFARRVEHYTAVAGQRESFVSNVENLESLWNDAIARQRMSVDLIKNSTFKTICSSFSKSVLSKWEDAKHGVLKGIYNCIKPGNNKYFNINPNCTECSRIRFQCIDCRMRVEKSLRGDDVVLAKDTCGICHLELEDSKFGPVESQPEEPQPSTSSQVFDAVFEEPPKFQMAPPLITEPDGTVSVSEFHHDIIYQLSDIGMKDFNALKNKYHHSMLSDFKQFLNKYNSQICVKLRRYPRYARSFQIFQSICESMCDCVHNCSINKPILLNNKFCFINPANPDSPDVLQELECQHGCWMNLPWKYYVTVKSCLKLKSDLREGWMLDLCERDIKYSTISINSIFSRMVKFVYDMYYGMMVPAVKTVFAFFSSFTGWIIGVSFLSMIFSTAILGVGCYQVAVDSNNIGGQIQDNACSLPNRVNRQSRETRHMVTGYQSKSYDSGKPKVTRVTKPKVKIPVRVSKDLNYQSSQQFSIVEERVKKNMSSIIVVYHDVDGSVKRIQNFGIMLRDQQMLIQKHYYDFWKRLDVSAKFYFHNPNIKMNSEFGTMLVNFFDLDIDWFYSDNGQYTDSNFGILYLPKIVPAFKDITKFIAKSSDHEYIKSDECYLYSSLNNRSMHCVMNLEFDKQVTDAHGWLRLDQCYSYRYTGQGLCGSVLMSSVLERPIIGIHFAGTSMYGYAEPLCMESFNDIKVKHYDYELHEMRLDGDEEKITFDTLLYPQGTIHKVYSHHQGSVSQYIPSLIQGIYEVDTEPNPLSPKDPRLPEGNPPLQRGVEHMGKPPLNFPRDQLEAACEDLKAVILQNVKPVRIKIDKVSLQDAICGNINIRGFEPLEWSSSEGFPLKSLRPSGVKGKRWLFELEETSEGYKLLGMHGELTRQLSVCYSLRKRGVRVPTLFTDCLKDTCIASEKCKIPGKTRIFSVSPVQYTIAFKQYFNDFMASYQNARLSAEHGIGMNVDSLEWSECANYITRFGNSIVAGDYKNYGPSLMLSCVEKAFDIIMAWYERYDPDIERQLIRRVLLSEILHAKHLCLNVVYGVPCGIPSGSPITTPLNSLVNSLYLRCAWKGITGESFSVMHDNVRILTYGDDVCINVSDEYKDIYNTESLYKYFLQYNIVFTDIDKSDKIIKYRNLDTVSFLKRNFKLHPNSQYIFLAPIDEQSIRKCVNWITRKGDPVENTIENCKQACELAFGHGPEYYNTVRECLQHECLKRLGKTFRTPSWFEKSEMCYNI